MAPCDPLDAHRQACNYSKFAWRTNGGPTGCREYCRNGGIDGQVVKVKRAVRGSFSKQVDHKRQLASFVESNIGRSFRILPNYLPKSSRWQLRYGLHISDRGLFTHNLYLGLQLEIYL